MATKLVDVSRLVAELSPNGRSAIDADPIEPAEPVEPSWPELPPEALAGLAGDVVRTFEPYTEADNAATLITTLTMFGNCVGRNPHIWIGESRHGANIFSVIAGKSSRARKGTSAAGPRRIFKAVDEQWLETRQIGGVGSGEGLIWAVRDPSEPKVDKKGETIIEDPGVSDKRLMLFEEEISGLFTVSGKEGSIVSETIRKAWDGPAVLYNTVKRSPIRATGAHVSVVGHVTIEEGRRKLTETDRANGVGNRFLWVVAQRSKELALPARVPEGQISELAGRLFKAIDFGRRAGATEFDDDARQLWERIYPVLTIDYPGLFGSLIARAEAQVVRLALIYATIDRSRAITPAHLLSALAFWDYCEASARYIFGDRTGDSVADRITDALAVAPEGLTESAIHDLFNRHESGSRVKAALNLLLKHKRVTLTEDRSTGGRPARVWALATLSEGITPIESPLELARRLIQESGISSPNSLSSQSHLVHDAADQAESELEDADEF